MKIELNYSTFESGDYTLIVIADDEKNLILTVMYRDDFGDSRELIYKDRLGHTLPNLIECDYMDNYEEFLFQESLVWDELINFDLYMAIQKLCKYNRPESKTKVILEY